MELSIVVPAYNEEERLPDFLESLIEFREKHFRSMEIIVVDDGSVDKTAAIVDELAKEKKDLRLVSYKPNRGKGWAVRQGVLASKGKDVIFMDADGATQPDQIPAMVEKLKEYDVVIGSRRHADANFQSTAFRRFIGNSFNAYVKFLFNFNHKDSQCGFKGFKNKIAKDLFSDLVAHRWIFDIEIYHKLNHKKYTMHELPIKWDHVEGSKISFFDPVKMGLRLLRLRADMYRWEKKVKSRSDGEIGMVSAPASPHPVQDITAPISHGMDIVTSQNADSVVPQDTDTAISKETTSSSSKTVDEK